MRGGLIGSERFLPSGLDKQNGSLLDYSWCMSRRYQGLDCESRTSRVRIPSYTPREFTGSQHIDCYRNLYAKIYRAVNEGKSPYCQGDSNPNAGAVEAGT